MVGNLNKDEENMVEERFQNKRGQMHIDSEHKFSSESLMLNIIQGSSGIPPYHDMMLKQTNNLSKSMFDFVKQKVTKKKKAELGLQEIKEDPLSVNI